MYENGKAKLAYDLVQIIDFDNPEDRWQEWNPKHRELVTNPALARAIGFFNIYQQSWRLIQRGKTLMHYENTTFAYHSEFIEYVKMEGATLADVFGYLFDVGAEKFFSEKAKKYLL